MIIHHSSFEVRSVRKVGIVIQPIFPSWHTEGLTIVAGYLVFEIRYVTFCRSTGYACMCCSAVDPALQIAWTFELINRSQKDLSKGQPPHLDYDFSYSL